jgi:hypothetical protein
MFGRLKDFIIARLQESSTFQGVFFLLAFFGVNGLNYRDPELLAGATALGALVSAFIKVFLPDKRQA